MAAAQEDMVDRVDRGAFRRHLYRRVAGVVIDLPSLAERREDIVRLAAHFASLGHRVLETDAEGVLLGHAWHENVRELRQVIERAGYLVENGTIGAGVLRDALALGAPRPREPAVPGAAAEHLLHTCVAHGWHAGRIARAMAMSRNTLRARLRELGVSLRERKKYLWRRIGQTNVDQSCAIAWDARGNRRSERDLGA